MSRDNSSPAEQGFWAIVHVAWPIDIVPASLTIVHPRHLTSVEWAVLRVVQEFHDSPPTTAEAAEELGIGDQSLLEETVRELLRLGALGLRDGTRPAALDNTLVTAPGAELFRRGLVDGEPVRHGFDFHFDALTDEPIEKPKALTAWPARSQIVSVAEPTRTSVGLDLARQFLSGIKLDLLRGGGEVRRVDAREDAPPRLEWTERRLGLDLRAAGELVACLIGGSSRQSALVADLDLVGNGVFRRRFARADEADHATTRDPVTFDAWRARCSRVLAPEQARAEAVALIDGAVSEVLVATEFLRLEGISEAVDRARAREGVAVVVTGAESPSCTDGALGVFVLSCRASAREEATCVVDAVRGLQLADVVIVSGGKHSAVELVGELSTEACRAAREEVVGLALAEIASTLRDRPDPDREVTLALVALSLSQDLVWWERASAAVRPTEPGLERFRAVALHAQDAQARALAAGATDVSSSLATVLAREWRATLAECGVATDVGRSDVRRELFAVAPVRVGPSEAIAWVLDQPVAMARGSEQGAVAFLVGLADDVDDRWGKDKARAVPRWNEAFEAAIRIEVHTPEAVDQTLTRLRQEGSGRDLALGVEVILRALPAPASSSQLGGWVRLASRCREASADAVTDRALAVARGLLRSAPGREDQVLLPLRELIPATKLSELLILERPTLADLVSVRARLATLGIAAPAAWWDGHLEKLLDRLSSASTTDQGAFASEALLRHRDWSGLVERCSGWAKRVIEKRRVPADVAGLRAHVLMLAALRPLVGASVTQAMLLDATRAALRSRPPRETEWSALVEHVAASGFDSAPVAALLSRRDRPPAGGGRGPAGDRNPRKGRRG